MEGLADWQSRLLDPVYAVLFIDAINVKIREGQVANRPIDLALGVTVDGERDVLGLWAGEHGDGEGAKYWLRVLSEIKNRGVRDVCMRWRRAERPARGGQRGLGEDDRPNMHRASLRNSFKYASKRDGRARKRPQARLYRRIRGGGARPVRRILRQVGETLPRHHPAMGKRVGRVRAFPVLRPGNKDGDLHDQRDRVDQRPAPRAVNARGHFPTEQAALKCLYLAIMSLDPTGKGRKRWTNRWKAALNAFDITFDGRLSAGRK